MLTGDGGDELFGGYDAYEAQALAARWDGLMPAVASRAADAVLSLVPPTEKKKGLINKARRFVDGLASAPAEIAHYRWMTFLSAATKRRLYTRAVPARRSPEATSIVRSTMRWRGSAATICSIVSSTPISASTSPTTSW